MRADHSLLRRDFSQLYSQGATEGGLCRGGRADHDLPTVANYAYRRARCIDDDLMRIYQADFSYFTGPNSFYPEKIIKGEPPNIKTQPKTQPEMIEGTGSKEEDTRREAVMLEFAGEYGRGVRQENVRSKTKELTRTLPYALSMCPTTITASSEEREDVTTAALLCMLMWHSGVPLYEFKPFTRKMTLWP